MQCCAPAAPGGCLKCFVAGLTAAMKAEWWQQQGDGGAAPPLLVVLNRGSDTVMMVMGAMSTKTSCNAPLCLYVVRLKQLVLFLIGMWLTVNTNRARWYCSKAWGGRVLAVCFAVVLVSVWAMVGCSCSPASSCNHPH